MAADSKPLTEPARHNASLPYPGTEQCVELPQFPKGSPLPFRRTIRRRELHQIVPLAGTTIYEMEQRAEFPRRFRLTPRCVGNPPAFSGRQKWNYAASASFCIGVMPPSAMFGRSWL